MFASNSATTHLNPSSATRRHNRAATRFTSTHYFEVDLNHPEDASFYSGFSGEVDSIFVPTYNLKPIGDAAALKLTFPTGKSAAISGRIEWIREFNPMVPETYPGLGIRFNAVDGATRKQIALYMLNHQSLFYDETPLPPPAALTSPESAGPSPQTAQVSHLISTDPFVSGLVRDVISLLQPDSPPADISAPRRHTSTAPHIAATASIFAVVIPTPPLRHNFHGGFKEEDSGPRIFITTETPLPIGTRTTLHLTLPGRRRLDAEGEVKWIRKYNPVVPKHISPPGMGLCLVNTTPAALHDASPYLSDPKATLFCEIA